MKNHIIISLLILSVGLSIGKRKEETKKYTIKEMNSFDNITGWTMVNNNWKNIKNEIPFWDIETDKESTYETKKNGKYNLQRITSYIVEELPEIVILTIIFNNGHYLYPSIYEDWMNYSTMRILIFNKEDLKDNLNFIKEKFDEIKVDMYTTYTGKEDYLSLKSTDEINNIIQNIIFNYLEKPQSDFSKKHNYRKFYIHYYSFENVIQYFLSSNNSYNSKYDIYGQKFTPLGEDIDVKYFEDKYFESPFNEFESFFKSLSD